MSRTITSANMQQFVPGDVVKLRASVYLSFGITSPMMTRRWTIAACECDLCALGRHVAVGDDRHIAIAALYLASELDGSDPNGPQDTDRVTAGISRGIRLAAEKYFRRLRCIGIGVARPSRRNRRRVP